MLIRKKSLILPGYNYKYEGDPATVFLVKRADFDHEVTIMKTSTSARVSASLAGLATQAALFTATLRASVLAPVSQTWRTLTGQQAPLAARVVRRYALPSTRTFSVAEGFFGFIPIESFESERYVLEVTHDGRCYQVEVPQHVYHQVTIGGQIEIHTH